MADGLYTESIEFLKAVAALRGLPTDRYRSLAFHASCFWTNEEFIDTMLLAKIPDEQVKGIFQ
jgi:hypothetical protein